MEKLSYVILPGYWYPENRKLMFERGIVGNVFGIESKSLISNNPVLQEMDWLPEKREIPVIGMLFSAGFCVWVFLFLLLYLLYQKKYCLLLTCLPLLFLYLTILVGPSNTEFRYILPIYLCNPIISVLIMNPLKEKPKEKFIKIENKTQK